MNVDPGDAHFEIVVQDNLAFCRDHRAHFKAPRTVLDSGGYDRRIYGGAAGGGKTVGLILEPLRHGGFKLQVRKLDLAGAWPAPLARSEMRGAVRSMTGKDFAEEAAPSSAWA